MLILVRPRWGSNWGGNQSLEIGSSRWSALESDGIWNQWGVNPRPAVFKSDGMVSRPFADALNFRPHSESVSVDIVHVHRCGGQNCGHLLTATTHSVRVRLSRHPDMDNRVALS